MQMKRLILLASIIALPATTVATEQGIKRHYGGDWLAKHRAKADRQATGNVAPSTVKAKTAP